MLPEGGAIKPCCNAAAAINRSKLPQKSSSISILINALNKWHVISEFKTWVVKSLMYYFLICKSFTCQSRLIFMHWLWKHQIEMEYYVLQFFFKSIKIQKMNIFSPFDKIFSCLNSIKCLFIKLFVFQQNLMKLNEVVVHTH